MTRINNFSGFTEYVAAASEGQWRVIERDTAVAPGSDETLRHMVADVVVPPSGPCFVADLSRDRGIRDWGESQASAQLMTRAVRWLPSLARSSEAARDLLRDLRERVGDDDVARIDALLSETPLHEIEESDRSRYW